MLDDVQYLTGLLDLNRATGTEMLLERAVWLVVERVHVRLGYVEVEAEPVDETERRVWRMYGCPRQHIDLIEARISRGIIRSAQATGAVTTACAMEDRRFRDSDSVRRWQIETVLCVAFGDSLAGTIYLQTPIGRSEFSASDRCDVERAAQRLQGLLEPYAYTIGPPLPPRLQGRLAMREKVAQAVKQHGANLSAIQRATGVSRKQQRSLLGTRRRKR